MRKGVPNDDDEPPENERFCSVHEDTPAFKQCSVCEKYFCARCMVHYYGLYYCDACGATHVPKAPTAKKHAVPQRTSPIPADAEPLPERHNESPRAGRALRLALMGLIPGIGIILDVIALVAVLGAFSELSEIRGMKGAGKAVAAMVIAFIWLAVQIGAAMLLVRYLVKTGISS